MARFALLDILVNNAGLMLLGTVVGADPEDWGRMLAVTSWTCCTSLTLHCRTWSKPPKDSPRRVADMVNISSIAGCTARNWCRVDNLTKFGVNGFIESVRQEVTQRHPGPRRRPRRA